MANEEIKKDEMNPKAKEAANQEISDEELDNVAGGAIYDYHGHMVTTLWNSCEQWKCQYCGTYKGTDNCPDHPKEGKRWCPDCKFVKKSGLHGARLHCTYWTC